MTLTLAYARRLARAAARRCTVGVTEQGNPSRGCWVCGGDRRGEAHPKESIESAARERFAEWRGRDGWPLFVKE